MEWVYQFLDEDLPFTRRQADAFFLRLMQESDFRPRWIWWLWEPVPHALPTPAQQLGGTARAW